MPKTPTPDKGEEWQEADDTPAESKFIGWPEKPQPDNPLIVEVLKAGASTLRGSEDLPEFEVKLLADFGNHRNGEPQPATAGSVKTLTCFQDILRDRIEQLKPQVGDQLRITFDRMAGRAKHFQVAIRRAAIVELDELIS